VDVLGEEETASQFATKIYEPRPSTCLPEQPASVEIPARTFSEEIQARICEQGISSKDLQVKATQYSKVSAEICLSQGCSRQFAPQISHLARSNSVQSEVQATLTHLLFLNV
jgi:hypothetical protein